MSELLVVLDALRREIQADRLAMTKTINDGFDRIEATMSLHVKDDASQFAAIKDTQLAVQGRLTALETKQTTVGRGLWAIFLTLLGTIASATAAYFFPRHP